MTASPRSLAHPRLVTSLLAASLIATLVAGLGGCSNSSGGGAPIEETIQPDDAAAAAAEAADEGAADDDEELVEKNSPDEIDHVLESVDSKTSQTFTESDITPGEGQPGDEITHNTTQQIPLELNDDVERWIEYFTVKDGERFRRFLERGEKYKPMIMAVLHDQGIPTEIYYQAMIESGFTTHATSRASAVGIWQFVRETGRRYGLRVDQYVDERRDPMRSTIAASLYLKDLYNVFQSWYLAMAAYNAGEGRIMGAIMRAKTRDFWEMVQNKALPAETMDYIPKFLAATTIGHNPRRYGFEELAAEMMPALASVPVPSPVRLSDVASTTGVPLDVLREHNPHLLRGVTPPGTGTYRLWIPKEHVEAVQDQVERLASLRIANLPRAKVASEGRGHGRSRGAASDPAPSDDRPRYHTVARGQTLARIAGIYGVSIADIRRLNKMHSSRLQVGQRLMVWAPERTSGTSGRGRGVSGKTAANLRHYKVQRGDNLNSLAKRFNVSIDELKKVNRLKRNTLYVGEVIKVAAPRRI
jgi:membrane-bound lytic murein transglycosylase D